MEIIANNVKLNYEVFGEGTPIILLHGNGEDLKIFDKLILKLKSKYKVYAIDSRCHGKSEKTKNISYELMRDDIIDFIKKLKIKKPILYGFSDGGIIGLLLAIKNSNLLSKLIVSGANLEPKGFKLMMRLYTNIGYFITRGKLFKLMKDEPHIKVADLKKVSVPTVILAGENDIVKLEHTKLICDNIKDSKLEIISKEDHCSYIVHSNKIYYILEKYL